MIRSPSLPQLQPQASASTSAPKPEEQPPETSETSSKKIKDFEEKVIQAIRSLLSDATKQSLDNDYFSLSDVSNTFQTLHKSPINQLCLEATNKRIGVVLSSQLLKKLKTQKKSNIWWIGLN